MLSPEKTKRGEGTQAIDRAAELFVRVLEGETSETIGEIALGTGLPKSTASRLIGALERHGLVQRDSVRGPLRPGPVVLRYARTRDASRDLVSVAERSLLRLAEESGETINLAVPTPFGVEHIAQVETRHIIGIGAWVGRHVSPHCSASGKVFLAAGASALPAGPLEALTPRSIVDPRRFELELETVRSTGFATSIDEIEVGLSAVAAGVLGASGTTVAALTISGPSVRIPRQRLTYLGGLLLQEAADLSHRLGYRKAAS